MNEQIDEVDHQRASAPSVGTGTVDGLFATFGFSTPRQKRAATRVMLIVLFVVSIGLSCFSMFSADMKSAQRQSIHDGVFVCMAAMVALLGAQSIRNNEDTHKGNHDIREEMQPIKIDVDLIEGRTNGPITKEFNEIKQRLDRLEMKLGAKQHTEHQPDRIEDHEL